MPVKNGTTSPPGLIGSWTNDRFRTYTGANIENHSDRIELLERQVANLVGIVTELRVDSRGHAERLRQLEDASRR